MQIRVPRGWTVEEAKWVEAKWRLIRKSQQKADEANNLWQKLTDEINWKHAREDERRRQRGEFPLTDLMKAQAKDASLPLKDAFAAGNWHARNAERHIHDLQLFLNMKQIGLLP
jgi:hypothetical protein